MTNRNNKGQFKKGMIPWNKGISHSKEVRKKMSESQRKRIVLPYKKVPIVYCYYCKKRVKKFPCEVSERNFCNRDCFHSWYKAHIFKCDYCGKLFKRSNYFKKYKYHFCSNVCRGEWLSENIRREKHPQWKGGYSTKDYYKFSRQRKEKIRKRDGYTCQICGVVWEKKKRQFDVHHIDGNKKNYHLDNLITLCGSCHSKYRKQLSEIKNKELIILEFLSGEPLI